MNRNDLIQENAGLKLILAAFIYQHGPLTLDPQSLEAADRLTVETRQDAQGNEVFYLKEVASY